MPLPENCQHCRSTIFPYTTLFRSPHKRPSGAAHIKEGAPAMTPPTADRMAGDAADSGSGKVTREVVLAAALQIIDRDGADGLSMRRLARALDRDPMILYRHAPNKAALLDGVAEMVLAQLTVDSADPDWAAPPRRPARRPAPPPPPGDSGGGALAPPRVVPLLVPRPLAPPLALRPPGT